MSEEQKRKKKKSKTTGSIVDEKASKVSRPKKKKPNPEDEIPKSKQLKEKLQTSRSSSGGSRSRSANKNEVRLCGNGKPMPSLAELEKMFEDSDSDGGEDKKADPKPYPSITSTPKSSPKLPEILTSPTSIGRIADRMLQFVTNITEPPLLLDDDGPVPAVIKPKKRKKTEIPYIVGCKERPYVPSNPNTKFCKGDEDYGVKPNNSDDEDDLPKKRAKRGENANFSKSIFNAASDEIAARLKEQDEGNSDASSDSNKTVAYEYYTPNTNNRVRSFSPLPSTSKDNEIFVKNDKLFNESLVVDNSSTNSVNDDDDMEIIETPYETIEIKDTLPVKPAIIENSEVIDLVEDSCDDTSDNKKDVKVNCDDSVQLVDVNPASPIPVEDYYSTYCSLDTNTSYNDDMCEVIDVDDVIAENAAIIKKYSRKDDFDTVTSVDMTHSVVSVVDSETSAVIADNDNHSIINEDITNAQMHENLTHSQINSNDNVTNAPVTNSIPTPIEVEESIQVAANNSNSEADFLIKILENNIQSIMCVIPGHRHLLKKALNNLQKGKCYQPNRIPRNCANAPSAAFVSQQCVSEAHQISPHIDKTSTSATSNSPEPDSKKLGDCPICMDTLSSKAVASTMCGHIFCMSCIKQSIKSNGKKCPTCRKTLRGAGFHQIFL